MDKAEATLVIKAFWEFAGWCQCGDPESAAVALRDMLRAHPAWETSPLTVQAAFGDHGGRALILRYMLDTFQLTEHGGGVSGAWLSERGKGVLAALEVDGAIEAVFDDEDLTYDGRHEPLVAFWNTCSGPFSGAMYPKNMESTVA